MKLKKNIATSEEGFIFNPGTGDSFTTNGIGSEIISMIKEGKEAATIIKSVCEKYDVEQIQFERDLDDFMSQLADSNILE